jgi:hypothetical protein
MGFILEGSTTLTATSRFSFWTNKEKSRYLFQRLKPKNEVKLNEYSFRLAQRRWTKITGQESEKVLKIWCLLLFQVLQKNRKFNKHYCIPHQFRETLR